MTRFLEFVRDDGVRASGYDELYAWSIEEPAAFWLAVWQFCGVVAHPETVPATPGGVLVGGHRMAPPDPVLGPRWFPEARLNFAANLLRYRDDREALVSWDESGRRGALTFGELAAEVAACAG